MAPKNRAADAALLTRRTLLKAAAVGAGLVFVHGAWLPEAAAKRVGAAHGASMRGVDLVRRRGRGQQGRFGLMFPDLDAYKVDRDLTDNLAAAMRDPDTGGRDTSKGGSGDNDAIPSGFTFLGQFIDHDLTMDRETLGNQQSDPDGSRNFRSPTLGLDSVYNRVQPDGVSAGAQHDRANRNKLLLEPNEFGVLDLPRNGDGTAKIADPRNEENLIITHLQIAAIRFHNRLVTDHRMDFERARRETTYHYQWVVMTEFLPLIVGQDRVDELVEIKRGRRPGSQNKFYRPRNPARIFTPLEFAVAAFRFGHTQVRNLYNPATPPPGITDTANRRNIQQPTAGATNLNGFRPIPKELRIDFRRFFFFDDNPSPLIPPTFNATRGMDALLSPNLLNLPASSLPNATDRVSLPGRNLERGVQVGLASGQDVAKAIGARVYSNEDLTANNALAAAAINDKGFKGQAPLWFYLLAESALTDDRKRLGPVGGTIIAETLVGIMAADRQSFFHAPRWEPMKDDFGMKDFLEYAGAVGRDAGGAG